MDSTLDNVIIIGGGPAGSAIGCYLLKKRDHENVRGGRIITVRFREVIGEVFVAYLTKLRFSSSGAGRLHSQVLRFLASARGQG